VELGELTDEHFEYAFRRQHMVNSPYVDIAIGVPVPPTSELPRLAGGRAHAGYRYGRTYYADKLRPRR
jgi:hypothetical protein